MHFFVLICLAFILGDYKYGSGIIEGVKSPFRPKERIKMHLHLKDLEIKGWFGDGIGEGLNVSCKLPSHFVHTMACYRLNLENK